MSQRFDREFYRNPKHVPSGPLFDLTPKAPRMPQDETSREARESIEPTAESLRNRILADLRRYTHTLSQGLTDEEICDGLNMNPSTERPRRGELCAMGLVKASELRRQSRSGRTCVVWKAV